jgi:hypothetical protein
MSWFDDFLKTQQAVVGSIPAAMGTVGKGLGDFFNDANNNANKHRANEQAYRSGNADVNRTLPQLPDVQRTDFGTSSMDPHYANKQQFDDANYNDHLAQDPLSQLRDLLNEKYQGNPMDTSALDQALNSQLAPIATARQQANDNYNKSDANLAAMHDAFKQQILGQAPQLQQQNADYQKNVGSIFDQTLKENADRQAADNAQKAEMFQRLGIAPAANQPDLVGQAIEQGNQKTESSKDARLAEAATMGQNDLARNTASASAVGNDGLQRRSDLSRQLQTILGNLGSKEADVNSKFQQDKQQLGQQQEDRNYQRFLADRNWNMQRYNTEINNQYKQAQLGNNSVDSLNNSTDPQVVSAVNDALANEPNIDMRNPNQVMQAVKNRQKNITPDGLNAIAEYIAKYNRAGTNKAYYPQQ